MENIYKNEVNGENVYFIILDNKLILMTKNSENNVVLSFFGGLSKNSKAKRKFTITKENYELYQYFLKLYNDFILYDSLEKQINFEELLKDYPVEYTSFKEEESGIKLAMKKDKDSIDIIIYKEKPTQYKDYTISADYHCQPLMNLYDNVEKNYKPYHQIDFEELLYKNSKTRTRK